MEHNQPLNLEEITKECGVISPNDKDESIKKLLALEESYEPHNLVKIYNHFLSVSNDAEILMNVIRCSDKLRDKSSLPYLVDILLLKNMAGSDDETREKFINVRVMSAKAIANLKDTSALNALLYCLNNKDENYKIRLTCADALGKIGDRFAVAPLIEIMSDENEKSVYVKESAASALGKIGDLRAVDSLVSILEAQKGIMNKFTFLKERVIEALGKLRLNDDKRVFTALKNSLLDDSAQIRINAIEALMESESDEAYDTIKACLRDRDFEVKKNALIALYNMRGRDILDEVMQGDHCESLKIEAASIIKEYEED